MIGRIGGKREKSLSVPLFTAMLLSSSPVAAYPLPLNVPIVFTPGTGQPQTIVSPPSARDGPIVIPELPLQAENSAAPDDATQATDSAEILVQARKHAPPGDPLQAINAQSFAVTQSIDKAIVGPVSLGFAKVVPTPVRRGLHNFLANLNEPVVFINFLLQHKIGKAAETLARFTINSTVGAGGLMDIAKRKPFNLPERRNSLADTLGFYGVKPGPFFFLPLVGPTTLRDVFGNTIDRLLLPTGIGKPFNQITYTIPTGLGGALDYRAGFDAKLNKIRESADPYTAAREYYLQGRQAEIDGLHSHHKEKVTTETTSIKAPTKGAVARPSTQGDGVASQPSSQ
jgi:phospholipid-binding lipoprotein MlaA